MKVLLEVKGTLEKVADHLRDKCSEVKENDDYIVGYNQVICGFLYHIYSINRFMGLTCYKFQQGI